MAEQLNLYSMIAFSLCGVFFLLSIFLWFRLNIRHVILSLSGKQQKRTIAQMKNYQEPVARKPKKVASKPVLKEEEGTIMLEPEEEQTVLLEPEKDDFELIDDIMLVHTKEKVE